MTRTIFKLPNADACALSSSEAEVLRRVSEGARIDSISSDLGLAEPIVKEYIKSILRKVRARNTERVSGVADLRALLERELFKEPREVSGTEP
jgi:DNA-binding NarL/FixJ family response regulator